MVDPKSDSVEVYGNLCVSIPISPFYAFCNLVCHDSSLHFSYVNSRKYREAIKILNKGAGTLLDHSQVGE